MSGPLNIVRSLPFRLTIYYAVVLVFALSLVYLVSYLLVSSLLAGRVDSFLGGEMKECTQIYKRGGLQAVREWAVTETGAIGQEDLFFRVYDGRSHVAFETDITRFDSKHNGVAATIPAEQPAGQEFRTFNLRGSEPTRAIMAPLDNGHWLMIVLSMSDDVRLINASMRLILLVMLVTAFVAVALGFFLSRNALRGISQVKRAAVDIAGGQVGRRAPVGRRGDEVDRLAQAFNAMASRVQGLLTQLRDANDQLAHELRHPLTHIRGRSELALMNASNPQTLQIVAGETVEACDRLLRTINTILELSETETGMNTLPQEEVRLDALLKEACDLFAPLAQDAGIALTVNAPPAKVRGASAKLQRVFANLLDNAVKYTPRGGHISVSLTQQHDLVVVTVRDTGRGVEEEDLPHIFDRFYRGQENRGILGNGLGLPLARSIARAHGGEITVTSVLKAGTEFRVTLPAVASEGNNT